MVRSTGLVNRRFYTAKSTQLFCIIETGEAADIADIQGCITEFIINEFLARVSYFKASVWYDEYT